jgi:hypothetical protein
MSSLFNNMLNPGQWLLLALIPPAIVALYFLKLKRQPIVVPSTYLWHRTIEDLHVNSLWQKMRQNLLMYLQLLLIGLLMLACLRPSWNSRQLAQDRFVFLIDVSASMSATDVSPTRLEEAKKKVDQLIQQMKPGDAAMLISFSDRAKVEQPFTTMQRKLRRRLARIEPTQRGSDITEALTAAGGRANPGRTSESGTTDVQVADAMPADVYVFSDGGFRSIPEFSWGNLRPIFVPVGRETSSNLAITTFTAGKTSNKSDRLQAIAEVTHFGEQPVTFSAELYLDDELLDAAEYSVDANGSEGIEFNLDDVREGVLRLELICEDDFEADNTAHLAMNPPDEAKVLLVTEGNYALETVLRTEEQGDRSIVQVIAPEAMNDSDYKLSATDGIYDLIIFDQCQPLELPRANTLFIDALPPGDTWTAKEAVTAPQMIDVDMVHPLTKYVDFGDVRFAEAREINGPPGQRILMEMDIGPVGVVAPREGFEDFVLGFGLLSNGEGGERLANTDWRLRLSFPVFFRNLISYMGNVDQSAAAALGARPGDTISIKTKIPQNEITITSPQGHATTVARNRDNSHKFFGTHELGVYEVDDNDPNSERRFAVNLFDTVESDIRPKDSFETAWTEVKAQQAMETKQVDFWRWLLMLALIVLVVEWYVFNKRIV